MTAQNASVNNYAHFKAFIYLPYSQAASHHHQNGFSKQERGTKHIHCQCTSARIQACLTYEELSREPTTIITFLLIPQ